MCQQGITQRYNVLSVSRQDSCDHTDLGVFHDASSGYINKYTYIFTQKCVEGVVLNKNNTGIS